MEIKKCLACGREMAAELDQCPQCRLSGQNQLFLSKEDFHKWEEQVLIPHQRSLLPKVFSGPDRMLILLGNGDLYALGNNKSGALGEGLPDYLSFPTRIASGVRYVAAATYLTLLVMSDGTNRMLGNSQFADRFVCSVPVERAYASDSSKEAATFWMLGQDGQWYFAGSNGNGLHLQRTLLRQLPALTVTWERTKEWYTFQPSKSPYRTIRELGHHHEGSPEFEALCEEVRRKRWYRAYIKEYGEENVEIKLGKAVKTKTLACRQVKEDTRYHEYAHPQTFERADMTSRYTPQVLKVNRNIYEASLCEEQPKTSYIFENCQSLMQFSDEKEHYSHWISSEEQELRKQAIVKALDIHTPRFWTFRRGLFDGFREAWVTDCRAYLDANHRFHIYRDHGKLADPLENIADCAVASSEYTKYHRILLVTLQGEVFHGSLEKLYRYGNWNHLEKLTF